MTATSVLGRIDESSKVRRLVNIDPYECVGALPAILADVSGERGPGLVG